MRWDEMGDRSKDLKTQVFRSIVTVLLHALSELQSRGVETGGSNRLCLWSLADFGHFQAWRESLKKPYHDLFRALRSRRTLHPCHRPIVTSKSLV